MIVYTLKIYAHILTVKGGDSMSVEINDVCRKERCDDSRCCICRIIKKCKCSFIQLYLPDNTIFTFTDPNTETTYTTFLVEKVFDDCCAILRAVTFIPGTTIEDGTFTTTRLCVTVDLCEFVAVFCFPDECFRC